MKVMSIALKAYITVGAFVYIATLFSYMLGPFFVDGASFLEKLSISVPATFLGMISIFRIITWGPSIIIWWLNMAEPSHISFLQWLAPGFFMQVIPN